jgi:hypothetical protein
MTLSWPRLGWLADLIFPRWSRLRNGSSLGHLLGRVAHPQRNLRPALFRLEPPSGLGVLFLLPCLFLLMFLERLSGSFRHLFTPAMTCHLLGNGWPPQAAPALT